MLTAIIKLSRQRDTLKTHTLDMQISNSYLVYFSFYLPTYDR